MDHDHHHHDHDHGHNGHHHHHGRDHTHDHGHGHDHHHHGDSATDYFTEQLLTILVVGLFGFVAIRMYQNGMLGHILAERFWTPVLVGGIVVLVLVAIRAISVWQEAGALKAHDHAHDHEHGPDCNHEGCDHAHTHEHEHTHAGPAHHHHGGDDHGHSHDLAWVVARMLVLVFPIALFFLGVPSTGFSKGHLEKLLGKEVDLNGASVADVEAKDGVVKRFNDLNDAAYDDAKRESLQGQTAELEGRFKRLGDNQFTLYRLKMTCCAADTVPLKVRIFTPTSLSGFNDFDWVKVKGRIQFVQVPNSDPPRYIPVIKVADITDVKKGDARNEYE